jgi:hypothetical protein
MIKRLSNEPAQAFFCERFLHSQKNNRKIKQKVSNKFKEISNLNSLSKSGMSDVALPGNACFEGSHMSSTWLHVTSVTTSSIT